MLSDEMGVKYGVLQRTKFSPIAFNTQLNDAKYLPIKSQFVGYADGFKMF